MAKKADRRVERTQQLLREALLSLIREKGFEALTVQEIIDRANVGRATFYTHFDNKEDLLVSGLDRLLESLKERQSQALARRGGVEERVFAFSHEVFAHAEEHRDLFRAMAGRESGAAIRRVWHKMLLDLVRQDVKAVAPRGGGGSVPTEALAQFITGALFGLLMWWFEGEVRLTGEEMNGVFRRLAIPTVKTTLPDLAALQRSGGR